MSQIPSPDRLKEIRQLTDCIYELKYVPENRENAIIELSKLRKFQDFAPMIWKTSGVVEELMQEILETYPLISPLTLNNKQSLKMCNVLAIIRCVMKHRETRRELVSCRLSLYLFPFLTNASATMTFQYLRHASLAVIFSLVENVEEDVIAQLLETEVVPVLLRIMESDLELCKVLATFTLQCILQSQIGMEYICQTNERFMRVSKLLADMVNSLVENPSVRLLKHIVPCFLRLSENLRCYDLNFRARVTLRECMPQQLINGTLNTWIHDDATRWSLAQLLRNLYPILLPVMLIPML